MTICKDTSYIDIYFTDTNTININAEKFFLVIINSHYNVFFKKQNELFSNKHYYNYKYIKIISK